jgi:penicillin-binding protein 1A
MVDAGYMTEGQVHGARLNPAHVIDQTDSYTPNYFLDWAFEEAQRLTQGRGEYNLIARTTVDVPLQQTAENAVEATLDRSARASRVDQAALVAMETDGAVRAMVGGRDYGDSQFNRATKALRQPGSSFKTYVYLMAIEHGARPNDRVVDSPVSCGNWSPRNYSGGYRGGMTLTIALAKSINTVAVKLSFNNPDRDTLIQTLHKLGLTHIRKSCSMALGDQGITPLDHTSGFATLASGGKHIKGYAITEIQNEQGDLIYNRQTDEPPAEQIFDREAVETLNEMLSHVITEGTGRRAQLDFTAAAGKTGTSSDYRDAWFMGFTGQYVVGVWYGNDSFTPMNRITGGSLPAETWKQVMIAAHTNYNIPEIPGVPLHPNQIEFANRIAEVKKADPTLGNFTDTGSGGGMPEKTRALLIGLSKMFKEAKPLDVTGSRGASLDEGAARFAGSPAQ